MEIPHCHPEAACSSERTTLLIISAAALFALLHWWLQPGMVIVFNDDFGYLRSVVETVRRHRPWTDDWLEPWSASLSVLSGAVWGVTGSFRLATQGLQALLLGFSFALAARLLIRRGFGARASLLVAAALLTTPTLAWKSVEFTGFVLCLPCLLLALESAGQNRWILFAAAAGVALASRQSALAWFAIPAFEGIRRLNAAGLKQWKLSARPWLACGLGAAVYALCSWGMNRTHAQSVMTTEMWQSLAAGPAMLRFAGALLVILACAGIANLTSVLLVDRAGWLGTPVKGFVTRGILPLVLMTGLFAVQTRSEVAVEHGFYSSAVGQVYLAVAGVLAGIGWLAAPARLSPGAIVGAVACAAIASLRSTVWDYYLADPAILGFFAVHPLRPSGPARQRCAWVRPVAAATLMAATVATHAWYIASLKRSLDTHRALEVLMETGLRDGRLQPGDLALAPFGFRGWHLYPYFVRNEGAAGGYIAEFDQYVAHGTLTYETRGYDDPRPLAQPGTVVETGVFPIAWSGRHQFILRRQPASKQPVTATDPTKYNFTPFPLSDREWTDSLSRRY